MISQKSETGEMKESPLGNLGSADQIWGEARKAIELHEQALAIAQEIADRQNESEILCNLGKAYLDTEESDRTIEYCTKCLDIARNIEYRKSEGEALGTLGKAFTSTGRPAKSPGSLRSGSQDLQRYRIPQGRSRSPLRPKPRPCTS